MRKIRDLMRLKFECGCSHKMIAASLGISSSTVSQYCRRLQDAQLTWPLSADLTDEQLEQKLYQRPQKNPNGDYKKIDWVYIHKELQRKHVTLIVLWNEYRTQHPQGVSYSQFCNLHRQWQAPLDVWMRQPHKAGERLFVDYAGHTMPIVNRQTGEVKDAQIFVATLGASNLIYTEATWTQMLPDWTQSHVNTFEYIGGCPALIIPDNLKSAVHKAHLYEPDLNPTYYDMATHYGVAILPTRVATPRDKAKVENAVRQVEQQILAKLRNRTFFCVHELNEAMRPLMEEVNHRPFQKIPGSRWSHYHEIEKAALKPLPTTRYVYAEWKNVKGGFNYHVEIDNHFYSIPFTLVKKKLQARYTGKTIEIFYKNQRMASHLRSYVKQGYTTDPSHMPKRHQHYAEWTPERIVSWAGKIGPSTARLVDAVTASRPHPQQGFRSCLGILRLAKSYGNERLEAACARALLIGAHSYKSIASILKNRLDQKPLPDASSPENTLPASHEYVRGQGYFE